MKIGYVLLLCLAWSWPFVLGETPRDATAFRVTPGLSQVVESDRLGRAIAITYSVSNPTQHGFELSVANKSCGCIEIVSSRWELDAESSVTIVAQASVPYSGSVDNAFAILARPLSQDEIAERLVFSFEIVATPGKRMIVAPQRVSSARLASGLPLVVSLSVFADSVPDGLSVRAADEARLEVRYLTPWRPAGDAAFAALIELDSAADSAASLIAAEEILLTARFGGKEERTGRIEVIRSEED